MEEKTTDTMTDSQLAGDATAPEVNDYAKAPPAGDHSRFVAGLHATDDVAQIEAPVTWKAYLICAFASFGGIFFGYDSGYINGVSGSQIFITDVMGPGWTALSSSRSSLVVSILSAGTFFGALIAGDVAERIGRKWTVITGCGIYLFGVVIQMLTGTGDALGEIVAGRLIAGVGVGFESAIVILYMSEIVRTTFALSATDGISADFSNSAQGRFAAPLSLATNSVSPLVFCWHLVSSTAPRAVPTPVSTAFPSASSLSGV
jgi:MFS family permease